MQETPIIQMLSHEELQLTLKNHAVITLATPLWIH